MYAVATYAMATNGAEAGAKLEEIIATLSARKEQKVFTVKGECQKSSDHRLPGWRRCSQGVEDLSMKRVLLLSASIPAPVSSRMSAPLRKGAAIRCWR